MLRVADVVRRIPALPEVDERTTAVTIRRVTYAGGRVGAEGDTGVQELGLVPRPRVREVSQQEIAGSGGRYEAGDVRVGPITPAYEGGGYSPCQLAPEITTNGVELVYVLAGGISGDYGRVDLQTDRAHSYFLILRRSRSTP